MERPQKERRDKRKTKHERCCQSLSVTPAASLPPVCLRLPSVHTPYLPSACGSLLRLPSAAPLYCFDLMLCKKIEFKLKKLVRKYNC